MNRHLALLPLLLLGCPQPEDPHTPQDPPAADVAPVITTIAGSGTPDPRPDTAPALQLGLDHPTGLALDPDGALYIADTHNHRVRKLDFATGTITTVAGGRRAGFDGDGGPATDARLFKPSDLALHDGALYIADTHNHRIRKLDLATGTITTVAGDGQEGAAGDDGPATAASLNYPCGLGVAPDGALYIADTHNHRIRKLDLTTGTITTAVGSADRSRQNAPVGVYVRDGSPATEARLSLPFDVAWTAAGDLLIVDSGHNRLRKVDHATGIISTVAGLGRDAHTGDDTPANEANLNQPRAVAVDRDGHIWISESGSHVVRRIHARTGLITTPIGSPPLVTEPGGFAGDGGPAQTARLNLPADLIAAPDGSLFIADSLNHRIRRVTFDTPDAP